MKKIMAIVATLVTFSAFACNLTQAQKDEKASNGMWQEASSDYSFPPAITDEMTANGLWGTNYEH